MLATLMNAWKIPDLRKRIGYTLMMIVVFRLGAAIPVPGISKEALTYLFANSSQNLLGLFDLMSGGSFKNFTIFALGISPYITASIIVNLLQIAIPSLEQLAKEGEAGKKKLVQMTRYGTVVLAVIQAIGITFGLFRNAFIDFNFMSGSVAVLTLTAGTAFLMYLGEKITENGIGNGISLFIFAGILSRLPSSTIFHLNRLFDPVNGFQANVLIQLVLFTIMALVVIACVIYITQGTRKIPVQYAKRVVGRKMYGGHSTHIPLKVNQSGVIPVIFSTSLLMFPQTIASFWPNSGFYTTLQKYFAPSSWGWNIFYVLLIIFFAYFYTSVTFNPIEVADNMKKNGGFIPGIRPGKPTSEYLMRTLNRLTLAGGIFLAAVAVLPNVLSSLGGIQTTFGGTALLIAVGVSIETVKQIEAQMVMRNYQGFLK